MAHPARFYREVLTTLVDAKLPFLIGGAYAFCRHVGMDRGTKDLDVMICKDDWPAVAQALRARAIATRLAFRHWLGKAVAPGAFVDIIFNGGSGLTPVARDWFAHAVAAKVFGHAVLLCPPEELLWSKSFVMERERFDGADVLHLLRVFADRLDWDRLVARFAGHEAVLLAHLTLFDYAYPGEAPRVPGWVEPTLRDAMRSAPAPRELCRGTLLSRAQYLVDVEEWGYCDARLPPYGTMSDRDWLTWTNAIDAKQTRIHPRRRTMTPRNAVTKRAGAGTRASSNKLTPAIPA